MGSALSTTRFLLGAGETDKAVADIWSQVVEEEEYEGLDTSNLEITNLVFEGGGTKGVAYCGALKALDDAGILKKLTRFAGTSAGAYFAMRVCLGATVDEILVTNFDDLRDMLYDSGSFVFFFNILRNFGWHAGSNLLSTLRSDVEKYTGSPDTTFYEWYRRTKRELCIPIVNLSSGRIEYCHPKTTPDMSIADAVRISMSLPIVFQPCKLLKQDGLHFLCDGGLLDNYPVKVFDGWYLSMEKENSFFHKMGSTDKPFEGALNMNTVGILLFNAEEEELGQSVYFKRYGKELVGPRPLTKLARERAKRYDLIQEKKKTKTSASDSSHIFLKKLSEFDVDGSGDINKAEWKAAMDKLFSSEEMRHHLVNIFGSLDLDLDKMFDEADIDQSGTLSFTECLEMLQRAGSPLRQCMTPCLPREIDGMGDFVGSIFATLDYKLREYVTRPEDAERTIGIYTDYIGTTDFEMMIEDKIYAIKQGWKAALGYLREASSGKNKT